MHPYGLLPGVVAALLAGAALAHGDAPHTGTSAPPRIEETAFGRTGDPRRVNRTVDIVMNDRMRFAPDRIEVRVGETVRFRVRNAGQAMHEMVIGTRAELEKHAVLMKKHPGMEHDEPYMAHVAPGKSGDIVWQFTRPGEFHFGCLVPGHFEAGMAGRILVRKGDGK